MTKSHFHGASPSCHLPRTCIGFGHKPGQLHAARKFTFRLDQDSEGVLDLHPQYPYHRNAADLTV
jgi:hypothetical protein